MDRIENDDFSSQLRSLRLILGKNFKPVSSKVLASLTGIALVSVRAVEAGRRRLNEDDRFNIELLLGAIWDAKSGQWVAARDKTPYTREKYEFHIRHLMRGPELEQVRAEYHKIIDQYLDGLEPAKLHFGLSKLYSGLRPILKQERSSRAAQAEKGITLLNRFQNSVAGFDKSLSKSGLLRSLKQKKGPASRR